MPKAGAACEKTSGRRGDDVLARRGRRPWSVIIKQIVDSRMCEKTSGNQDCLTDFSVRWPAKPSGTILFFVLWGVSRVGCMESRRTLPRSGRRVPSPRGDYPLNPNEKPLFGD